jgi:hypothetical protein
MLDTYEAVAVANDPELNSAVCILYNLVRVVFHALQLARPLHAYQGLETGFLACICTLN